ncbi:TMV resistance protein N-like [Prosopis cineraria]|uniref:TMV resistance protein N-like n=1 Tax=Prosopis cineraria TaxID=364024 RepID=UPI00240EF24D|nr:TMV resistance protein N-like [Prosopis cineraria]
MLPPKRFHNNDHLVGLKPRVEELMSIINKSDLYVGDLWNWWNWLSHKKVLLVLDDVDEVEQLEQLAGGCDWFGRGSKIIVTTRNKQLLNACIVKSTCEMKKLNEHDSLELFCWHAFRMSQPPKVNENMSARVIRYCERIQERTTHEVLKISYDCLQDAAKHIFLDIACFFTHKPLEFVEDILEACQHWARFYIEVLVDKSLITIDDNNGSLYMHDLIQQMGKEGTINIEAIILNPPQQEKVEWDGLAFEKMNKLKILIVRNAQFSTSPKYFHYSLRFLDWKGYPSASQIFLLQDLFASSYMEVFSDCKNHSSTKEVSQKFSIGLDIYLKEKVEHETYMDFSLCELITEVPDLSQFQSLKTLSFRECQNLVKVHDSVGSLSMLERLDASECTKRTIFPHEINMASLQELDLSHCKSLDYLPSIVGKMEYLMQILAEDTAITELPPSIENLPILDRLVLSSCTYLRELPNSLLKLEYLKELELSGIQPACTKPLINVMQQSQPVGVSCSNVEDLDLENCGLLDEDLHVILTCFQNVKELNLPGNDFVSLPECIKECAYLEKLNLSDCKRLRDIPELPSTLQQIAAEDCTSLTTESLDRLCHVFLTDLEWNFNDEDLEGLNKFLELDWNDVEIHFTRDPPDISTVNCGVYVDKEQTDMDNVQFKSSDVLSMSSSTISLKRRGINLLLNEKPPKKLLRN